jgi:hypothetical protein
MSHDALEDRAHHQSDNDHDNRPPMGMKDEMMEAHAWIGPTPQPPYRRRVRF